MNGYSDCEADNQSNLAPKPSHKGIPKLRGISVSNRSLPAYSPIRLDLLVRGSKS